MAKRNNSKKKKITANILNQNVALKKKPKFIFSLQSETKVKKSRYKLILCRENI